jgi:alpha-glucosidase (family GH31 glycosyl hydrolase)
MHSLSGTLEVSTTSDWFKKNNKRPMVFEKAGFAGIGKFGSRYIGNNYAD